MKYLDEYRDGELTKKLLAEINQSVTRPWKISDALGAIRKTVPGSMMTSSSSTGTGRRRACPGT